MTDWLTLSESDTRRFGLRVARHPIGSPPTTAADVVGAMRALAADIAILRVDAGDRDMAAALVASGATIRQADTLVCYGRSLDPPLPPPSGDAPPVRRAGAGDRRALERIATLGFSGYRSHYGASPCFPPAWVEAGYVEWALSHLESRDVRDQTWLVESPEGPAGFATLRADAGTGEVDILLNAVLPGQQGRGLYRSLVAQALRSCRDEGIRRATVSTQVWNIRVQRAWTALGFQLERAYSTYHVQGPRS